MANRPSGGKGLKNEEKTFGIPDEGVEVILQVLAGLAVLCALLAYSLGIIRLPLSIGLLEQEGSVNSTECLETVYVKERQPFDFETYTCQYNRDEKGTIGGRVCRRIETQAGRCTREYIYVLGPER